MSCKQNDIYRESRKEFEDEESRYEAWDEMVRESEWLAAREDHERHKEAGEFPVMNCPICAEIVCTECNGRGIRSIYHAPDIDCDECGTTGVKQT